MSERVEQVPLGNLSGMARPEEYLWDLDQAQNEILEPPQLSDLPPAPPSEDALIPEQAPPIEQVQPTKRRLRKVMPRQTGENDHAVISEPLRADEMVALQHKLKKQPILYEKARRTEILSRWAHGWGYVAGLLLSAYALYLTLPDYFEKLKNPEVTALPNILNENISADLLARYEEMQIGEILTIAGSISLMFLAVLLTCLMCVLTLRTILIRRPALFIPAIVYVFGSLLTWNAIFVHTMSPFPVLLTGLILLVLGMAAEWILRRIRLG